MNRLAKEKSPYLLQHQHNPVNWWPWGEEAIAQAKSEDKPIFLSIGYSTCYWCHVMEGECFEDSEVAAILNEHFVCIKVDREERPDLDALYMEAVVAVSGHGGWPLSAFLDCDLKPFFGGTYFPKPNFLGVLNKLSEAWNTNRKQITEASEQLYDVLQVTGRSTQTHELTPELWQQAYLALQQSYDSQFAGFGPAPKFPAGGTIRFLLRYYRRFNEEEALHMARSTLEAMAKGGLYDQVGGGFHRYSTDEQWLVPHFEKMLYDNALLVPAYLECWQLTGDDFLKEIANSTLEYIIRELRSEEGGFYCAEDAGSVGKEGEYYVWLETELEDLLSAEEFNLVKEVFDVSLAGNFESSLNIPRISEDSSWAKRYSPEVVAVCSKLLELRSERQKPHLDDKILVAWNALTISALCKGYQVLQNDDYLQAAQQAAAFIKKTLFKDSELFRRYREQDTRFHAYLEDHTFLIQALLDLYQCDADIAWLEWAQQLQKEVDELFWDSSEGGYFASSDKDPTVIVRKKEHSDTALPSASAVAAANLFRLSFLTLDKGYQERGSKALSAFSGFVKKYPAAFSYTLMALEYIHFGPLEVVVTASKDSKLTSEISQLLFEQFQPTLVLAAGEDSEPKILAERDRDSIYVCVDGTCSPALKLAQEAVAEINKRVLQ